MNDPARKVRYRRPPSWEIHSADGIRVVGGTDPDWWDAACPAEPLPIYSTDCTEAPA